MGDTFELKILSVSDTHGALINRNYADNSRTEYGLSRLATHIREIKDDSTLLIDCGDTIQGSPLMYYHQLHREECVNPVATVYNHLGVDYFIPGNHDFNYGTPYLRDFISELNASVLSANILDEEGKEAFGIPFDIISYPNGVKIGLIGLTTDYIPNWERKENIEGLTFVSPLEMLKKYLPVLKKEGVHAIVVAYHGGFERDLDTNAPYIQDTLENVGSRILNQFPEIDVLLTGHQHRSIAKKVGNTIVIQPASNGRAMGSLRLYFERADDWKLSKSECELLWAKDYPSDPQSEELVSEILERTNRFLDEPIGYVPDNDLRIQDLFQARLHKHKIVTFINQVQLIASKAMISAASLANDITGFDQLITVRNVLSTYVYPNTLTVLRINGRLLRQALERNAEYFVFDESGNVTFNPKYAYPKVEHYNYDMFDGIAYTIDLRRPMGSRITSLKYGGKKVLDTDEFTLVLNNYRASGGGEFEMYQGLEIVAELQLDVAELMTNYVREKKTIIVPNIENIKIVY